MVTYETLDLYGKVEASCKIVVEPAPADSPDVKKPPAPPKVSTIRLSPASRTRAVPKSGAQTKKAD